MNNNMKTKYLIIILSIIAMSFLSVSCNKINQTDDKNKIDIKGSMTNGDMRAPNIEAYLEGNTVWVQFYEDFGECTVSITSREGYVLTYETIKTYPNASWRFFMDDQPLSRYHLVINNGTDEAEGWFFNFRMAAVRPRP